MKITINNYQFKITWFSVLWWLAIGLFMFFTTTNLQYNTAFVDEAIYATVGEEYLRGSTWERAISWMGGSYVYPIISAHVNRFGGLEAIRLLAAACVLLTGIIVYKIGNRIADRKVGLLGMILFLFSAISLDLAILGTYDTPSLLCLSVGFYLFWNSLQNNRFKRFSYLIMSAVLVAMAILIKYVAIFWLPVFGLLWLTKRPIRLVDVVLWGLIILSFLLPYVHIYQYDLYDYFTGTNSIEIKSRVAISQDIVNALYVQFIGVFLALLAFRQKQNRISWVMIGILLVGGILPILYHLGSSNIRSIWKHMVYGSLFLSPLAAWGFLNTSRYFQTIKQKTSWLTNISQLSYAILLIILVFGLWRNFDRHWRFERSWPSYSKTIAYLDRNLDENDRVLAEASAVLKYHLFTGFQNPEAWASTWYLEHEGLYGTDAMKAALNDRKFKYVILSGYFTPWINEQINTELVANYELVMVEPYKVSGVYEMTTQTWVVKSDGPTDVFISQGEESNSDN